VIVVAIWQQVLGGSGIFVHTLRDLGLPTINIMTEPALFKPLVVLQLIWKETGWATIIYLAALLNIEAALYEAAVVDGANRWQRLWHVTLPGIMGVTVLLLILRLGLVLTVGFEQILLQRNAVGPAAGEVLDTYVYFKGIVGGQWGITAAAGLIKGILGTILVLSANKLAHKLGQSGVYGNAS
jgi:putative aldouronate transport system permease protein